jgi:hypothetical protein
MAITAIVYVTIHTKSANVRERIFHGAAKAEVRAEQATAAGRAHNAITATSSKMATLCHTSGVILGSPQ